MSRSRKEQFQIRDFKGIDLNENARVNNPGSWRRLENLYMEVPGKLSQRPGSTLFAWRYVRGEGTPEDWIEEPGGDSGQGYPDKYPGDPNRDIPEDIERKANKTIENSRIDQVLGNKKWIRIEDIATTGTFEDDIYNPSF